MALPSGSQLSCCVSGVGTAAWLITPSVGPLLLFAFLTLPFGVLSKEPPLIFPVEEEIGPGAVIADVVGKSHLPSRYDSQTLAKLEFKFLTGPGRANMTIDQRSGLISTNGRLDRDVLCPNFYTCVVPLDIAVQPIQYFQIIKAHVEIMDLNDNTPHFPEPSIVFQVLESAHPGNTAFIVPEALDPDSPPNSVQGYKLDTRGSDTWGLQVSEELDGSRGIRLVLSETLDREKQSHYHLQVLAYDGGTISRTGSVDVYIEVQDANDNSPVFEQESYEVTIDENTPPMTTIARLHAEDADWGPNGQVMYTLGGRSATNYGHLFGVNNSTGQVYIKGAVDYETTSTYHLTVVARDKGPGSIPTTVTLMVHVRDLNDHAPVITATSLDASNNYSVSEDAPVGTFVALVTVEDPDSGLNGQFNCSLKHRKFEMLLMSPGEYHLVTKDSLDREQKADFNLSIVCTDQGSAPKTGVKHISVYVTDVNDNTPEFNPKSYIAQLFENNFIGAQVTRVSATDKDSGENARIVYGLGANDLANFEINSETGEVTARNSLDRERNSEYHLQVMARDCGKPLSRTATTSLVVRVLDVNDEKPQFSNVNDAVGVSENQHPGFLVHKVSALDADGPMYNKFTYSLLPAGSLSDAFEIDADTGEIHTTRQLDREQQTHYELLVVARDTNSPSLSSTATLRIVVIDENDNAPHFIFPTPTNNTVQFSNKVPLGHIITQVRAEDEDYGHNQRLTYQVTAGNHEGIFTMDPQSGVVSVNINLRDFPDNKTWHLEVTATDHGDDPRLTTAMLHLVLNHSLALQPGGMFSNLFEGTNFFILVIIGCVSGALIVVLLIVIVVLLRRQQLKRRRMHRYNCRMHALQRMAAQEMIADSAKKDGTYQNSKADYTMIPKKEPDCFTSDDNKDLMDLSHEKSRQWLETLEPNRYEATPTRGANPLPDAKLSEAPPNGRANQPIRKECSTLPRAGNNPSPRPLSSVLEDSASDSVKSGEGSNTDSGRGHSDADNGDHSSHGPVKSVQFQPLPPPPPAPQYSTLPSSYSRYTRPPAHAQSFTSFRGNNNNAAEQPSPQQPPQNGIYVDKKLVTGNGPETVAIKPQGSPILRNTRRVLTPSTPRMEDYHSPKQDGRLLYSPGVGIGADRETDC